MPDEQPLVGSVEIAMNGCYNSNLPEVANSQV